MEKLSKKPRKGKSPKADKQDGLTPGSTIEAELPIRPKQLEVPGIERPRIRALEEASEAYVLKRDARMALTKKECETKAVLIDLMHRNADKIGRDADGGLTYRYEDMMVSLKPKDETLKVKHVSKDDVEVGQAPKDDSEGAD